MDVNLAFSSVFYLKTCVFKRLCSFAGLDLENYLHYASNLCSNSLILLESSLCSGLWTRESLLFSQKSSKKAGPSATIWLNGRVTGLVLA